MMQEQQEHDITKAVIYCRVSSTKQSVRGDGLGSQETRCREFAKYKGYEIVEVFGDDMSGSVTTRPGMAAMLEFLRRHRKEPHAVIIDDISRLARGLMAHFELRMKIGNAGGVLVSPSIEFGEDSDSQLVENRSPLSRSISARRTANRPSTACGRVCRMAIGCFRPLSATATSDPAGAAKYS